MSEEAEGTKLTTEDTRMQKKIDTNYNEAKDAKKTKIPRITQQGE